MTWGVDFAGNPRTVRGLGGHRIVRYHSRMAARSSEQLAQLAHELANLTREERAKVLAHVARLGETPERRQFGAPKLSGGTRWSGGGLGPARRDGHEGRRSDRRSEH